MDEKPVENTAARQKRPVRWGVMVAALALSVVSCGVCACLYFFADRNGVTSPWRELPVPPSRPVELLYATPQMVYVQVESGQVYRCWYGDGPDACLAVEAVPLNKNTAWPCPDAHLAYWPLTSPPNERVRCLETRGAYLEQTYDVLYALDREGKLWRWAALGSANDALILPLYCLGGAVAGLLPGLLVALVVFLVGRRRKGKQE